MKPGAEKIYCAIDTANLKEAKTLASALKGAVGGLKLGLEFYSAVGVKGVEEIAALGLPIFLDLKLHDIPNTVAKAITALGPLVPKMMTIHTAGGVAMMQAAKTASLASAEKYGYPAPMILGVTVLTSLDDNDLAAMGVKARSAEQVVTLAGLAREAGLDGIVCSPLEIERIRKEFGNNLKLVVPGIRPEGAEKGDQKRIMTPSQAIEKGADFLVIGRPITGASYPAAAAHAIADSLAAH